MKIKKWNMADTYQNGFVDSRMALLSEALSYPYVHCEKVMDARPHFTTSNEQILECIDETDRELVCRVAASKYLTAHQTWQYARLSGQAMDEEEVSIRMSGLAEKMVLRSLCLVLPDDVKGIMVYCLDFWGNQVAYNGGVYLHTGIKYISEKTRQEKGYKIDSPEDVKKVIVGNRILLDLLMRGRLVESFGFLETTSVQSGLPEDKSAIIRTTLSAKCLTGERLLVEVARNNPQSMKGLVDKLFRYEKIVSSGRYVAHNQNGDAKVPRLVVCGESKIHNERIFEAIAAAGFPVWKCELLFTEDSQWIPMTERPFYRFNRNYEREQVDIWTSAMESGVSKESAARTEGLLGRLWGMLGGLFGARNRKAA